MNILISPNSFKGTFSSVKASELIRKSLTNYIDENNIKSLPIADGGDGTLELFKYFFKYMTIKIESLNASKKKINSEYIIIDNGKTAVIEFANTCGLAINKDNKSDLFFLSSDGVGVQIQSALRNKVENIILCLGGSATIDAGLGILRSLGVKFFNINGDIIENKNPLIDFFKIDFSETKINQNVNFILLTDVDNKILGEKGCVKVFGKQKGLQKNQIPKFENSIKRLARYFMNKFNYDPKIVLGGGAAGGAAAFLKFFLNANIENGAEYLFKKINYLRYVENNSIIITGEGKLDSQTLNFKGPYSLIKFLKKNKKKFFSIAIGGVVDYKSINELLKTFDLIFSSCNLKNSKKCIENSKENLSNISTKIAQIIVKKFNSNNLI